MMDRIKRCRNLCVYILLKVVNGCIVVFVTTFMIVFLGLYGSSIKGENANAYFMLQSVAWSGCIFQTLTTVFVLLPLCFFSKTFRGVITERMWCCFNFRFSGAVLGLVGALNYYGTGGVASHVAPSLQAVLSQISMPLTAFLEWIYLKKRFSICMTFFVVLTCVGSLISVVPSLIGKVKSPDGSSLPMYILWIILFGAGNGITAFTLIGNKQTLDSTPKKNDAEKKKSRKLSKFIDSYMLSLFVNYWLTLFLFVLPGWLLFDLNFFSFSSVSGWFFQVRNCLLDEGTTKCDNNSLWILCVFSVAMFLNNLFTAYVAAVEDATFVAIVSSVSPMFASIIFHLPVIIFGVSKWKSPLFAYSEGFSWWDCFLFGGLLVSMICIIFYSILDQDDNKLKRQRLEGWLYSKFDISLSCSEWIQRWHIKYCCFVQICLSKKRKVFEKKIKEEEEEREESIFQRKNESINVDEKKEFLESSPLLVQLETEVVMKKDVHPNHDGVDIENQ